MRPLFVTACVILVAGCRSPVSDLTVRDEQQALTLARQYELKLLREKYGPDVDIRALASSREKPHSVKETANRYKFVFRKPLEPRGGGYIKTFWVNKTTGQVGRGAWTLGR
jgi:hypothetical protein